MKASKKEMGTTKQMCDEVERDEINDERELVEEELVSWGKKGFLGLRHEGKFFCLGCGYKVMKDEKFEKKDMITRDDIDKDKSKAFACTKCNKIVGQD